MILTTLLCVTAYLAVTLSSVDCSSAIRLEIDTAECGWKPPSASLSVGYTMMDFKLEQADVPKENIDALYQMVFDEEADCRKRYNMRKNSNMLQSLRQFKLARDLDRRDCHDHCTYVLARSICISATPLYACQPRSEKQNRVKIMLEAKVFPLIERCQLPLVVRALLNATMVDPNLYQTVDYIAYRMIDFETFIKFNTIIDLILLHSKPFYAIRRVLRPTRAGFYNNLVQIMLYLDRRSVGQELSAAIYSLNIQSGRARQFYQQLILDPCLRFINIMHTTMDPTIFYGRLMELKPNRFEVDDDLTMGTKIEYFKLVLLYEACAYLDNHDDIIDYRVLAENLLGVDPS